MSDLAELERRLREAAAARESVAWSRTNGGQEWTLEAMLAEEAADAVAAIADALERTGCEDLDEIAGNLIETREELEEVKGERSHDLAYLTIVQEARDEYRIRFLETEAELSAAREALKGAEEAFAQIAASERARASRIDPRLLTTAEAVALDALSALRPAQGKDPAGFRDPPPPRNSMTGALDSPP